MLVPVLVSLLLLAADPPPSAPTNPTELESVQEFSREIAALMNSRSAEALNALFDVEALLYRIFDLEGLRTGTRIGFALAFRATYAPGKLICERTMSPEVAWAESLRVTKNEDGSYTSLVRVVRRKTVFVYF